MNTQLENEATLVAEARPDNEGYTMSQHTEYKVIQGRPSLIEEKLNELSKDGVSGQKIKEVEQKQQRYLDTIEDVRNILLIAAYKRQR